MKFKILDEEFYDHAIENYRDLNELHIPSVEEGFFISNNYYNDFLGDDKEYMTTESINDDQIIVINLFLGVILPAPKNKKHPVILVKLF
jgi:hypothetical protein